MGVNSLPKTVTRQRRGCDLNPGPSAPESSTLTTRLPSHPFKDVNSVREYVFFVFSDCKKNMTFYVFLNDVSKSRKKSSAKV